MRKLLSLGLATTLAACSPLHKIQTYQSTIDIHHTEIVVGGEYIVFSDFTRCRVDFEEDKPEELFFQSFHPNSKTESKLLKRYCPDTAVADYINENDF